MMRTLWACLLLTVLAGPIAAQPALQPDQRVRMTLRGGGDSLALSGTVLVVTRDSLLLQGRRDQRSVALSQIAMLEVARDDGNRIRWALVGAVLGSVAGYGVRELDRLGSRREVFVPTICPPEGTVCAGKRETVPYSERRGMLFVLSGATLGTVLGVFHPGLRWEVLPLPGAGEQPAAEERATR